MKIQLWRRKNYDKTKHNLYVRYRISQDKAKVESLNLWEWINPKSNIEIEHNKNVQIACVEIIRRAKDDIDNQRVNLNLDRSNENSFKASFFKFSNIKNTEAIYNFITRFDDKIEIKKNNQINEAYLKNLKFSIEKNINEGLINGSTATKYWNNFKTVLINLNKNKLCEYPKVGGVAFSKENRKKITFDKREIERLKETEIKKWKDLKKAFSTLIDLEELAILKKFQ